MFELLSAGKIVEDADRGNGVVRGIDHVVGHETLDIADDRDRPLLDPARQFFGRAGFCLALTDGGIHESLLHQWLLAPRSTDALLHRKGAPSAVGQR